MSEFFNNIKNDQLANKVWFSKYALRDKAGNLLETTPEEGIARIVNEIVRIDTQFNNDQINKDFARRIEEYLNNGVIIPGGSNLYGIGNNHSVVSLSNCFVISGNGEDSYGSIFRSDQEIVQIAKRRGGVGLDISHLRPALSPVNNSAQSSTGAVSFAPRFSHSIREVAQDGRRGALMLTISINHPDSPEFVSMKSDTTSVTGANVSLKVTDEFMKAAINQKNNDFILRYPVDSEPQPSVCTEYDTLYTAENGTMHKKIDAKKLFEKIVHNAWAHAEPGLLLWDNVLRNSVPDVYDHFQTVSTNPCGEIPLSPYDSCRLLSIVLTSFVKNPFTDKAYFDFNEFFTVISVAVQAMDDIIELEVDKIRQIIKKITLDKESDETKLTELSLWNRILESTILGRRAGISIIGHADVAAMLGFNYLSKESLLLYEKLHKELLNRAYSASSDLAVQRGSFGVFNFEKEFEALNKTMLENSVIDKIRTQGRRNIALLTIPPSGSLSIIRGISSGIEPVFMVSYKRRRKVNPNDKNVTVTFVDEVGDAWEEYTVVHPGFSKYMLIKFGITKDQIGRMPDDELNSYIKSSPYNQQTAEFIDPIEKVRMQGMIQKYIDHSISVTTNLVSTATELDVYNIYKEAWETGCKGVTVYRDGVRSGVLVKSIESTTLNAFSYREAHKRPRAVECDVIRAMYKGKKYIVLVGLQNGIPYETFLFSAENVTVSPNMETGLIVKKRKKVYNLATEDGTVIVEDILNEMRYPEHGYVTKLISLSLRHGADIKFVVEQLDDDYGDITNISKVLARSLRRYIPVDSEVIKTGKPCPECGAELVSEGGCEQCYSCGYGACK